MTFITATPQKEDNKKLILCKQCAQSISYSQMKLVPDNPERFSRKVTMLSVWTGFVLLHAFYCGSLTSYLATGINVIVTNEI